MTMHRGYDWVDQSDGSWDVYATDRKIANVSQNPGGYWYLTADPGSTYADGLELIQIIDEGREIGL